MGGDAEKMKKISSTADALLENLDKEWGSRA